MSRRTRTLTAVLAGASIALVGCSSGDDTDDAGTTPSASTSSDDGSPEETSAAEETTSTDDDGGSGDASSDLVAWAGDLCTGIAPIDDQFDDFEDFEPTGSDPAAVVQSLQDAFGQLGPAFDDARAAVESAGPPPVDDGQQIYDDMITLFTGAGDAFGQIGDELAAIDPNDPEALNELTPLFTDLAPQLETLSADLDAAFSSPEMEAAFDEAPACDDLDITG